MRVNKVTPIVSINRLRNEKQKREQEAKKRKGKRTPFDPGPGGIA